VNNFSIPFFYLAAWLYLHVKLSGMPFLSEFHKKQFQTFKVAYFVWGGSRLLAGITDVLYNQYRDSIFNNLDFFQKQKELDLLVLTKYILYLFLYLFLSEVQPMNLTLDNSYIEMYGLILFKI
jgi:hypothetical protein